MMRGQDRMKRGAAAISVLLHRALGDRNDGRLGMLLHHRVSPRPAGLPEPPYNVSPDVFRQQLLGLTDAGYRFVKMSDALNAKRSRTPLPPRSVVLTYDDAYESVYQYAFPVMQELGVPGVAFLSTSFLDSEDPFPFDEWSQTYRDRLPPEDYRPIRIAQCREMIASGLFEFGAHTHSHLDFRGRPEAFRQDVAQSVAIIRDLFQLDEVTFAFPWGATGNAEGELIDAARKAGVCCAVTTEGELIDLFADDHFNWGRFVVFPWDTASTLSAKLAGCYGWARRIKQSLSRVKQYPKRLVQTSPVWPEVLPVWSDVVVEASGACAGVLM